MMKNCMLAMVIGLVSMNVQADDRVVVATQVATMKGNPAVTCRVFAEASERYELVWDGACLDGAVDGLGTLSFSNPSWGSVVSITATYSLGHVTGLGVGRFVKDGVSNVCAVDFDDMDEPNVCWNAHKGAYTGDLVE